MAFQSFHYRLAPEIMRNAGLSARENCTQSVICAPFCHGFCLHIYTWAHLESILYSLIITHSHSYIPTPLSQMQTTYSTSSPIDTHTYTLILTMKAVSHCTSVLIGPGVQCVAVTMTNNPFRAERMSNSCLVRGERERKREVNCPLAFIQLLP